MTKVQAKDIKNQAFLTTGTSPDYEIVIPGETSYADMDRMEILVNFHSAGTGAITLNINGLGAKATGLTDVDVDSYYIMIYDLSKDSLETVSGEGGSGGGLKSDVVTFSRTSTNAGDVIYNHNLGMIPETIIISQVRDGFESTGTWTSDNTQKCIYASGSQGSTNSGQIIYYRSGDWGEITNVTTTSFTITYNTRSYDGSKFVATLLGGSGGNGGSPTQSYTAFQKDVVLGEDVTAGDGKGAVFFGIGEENTKQVTETTGSVWDASVGNDTYDILRHPIIVPRDENIAYILKEYICDIKKVGTPTDNFQIDIYENDGTTLIASLTDIAGAGLTTSYVSTDVISSDVDLSSYKGEVVLIQFSRSGTQDVANYYQIQGISSSAGFEYFSSPNRVGLGAKIYHTEQRAYNFVQNKVWKADLRYDGTAKCDGIVVESGSDGDIKTIVKAGGLAQTTALQGEGYWLDTTISETLVGTSATQSDATEYIVDSPAQFVKRFYISNKYIEKFEYEVHGTYYTSGENTRNIKIYLNGNLIATQAGQDTSYVSKTVTIDEYVDAGYIDIYLDPQREPGRASYIKNQVVTVQDYDLEVDTFYSVVVPSSYTPFLIGKGTTNTEIELMINEQNFNFINPGYISIGGDKYELFTSSATKSLDTTTETIVKSFKVGDTYTSVGGILPGEKRVQFDYTYNGGGYGNSRTRRRMYVNGIMVKSRDASGSSSTSGVFNFDSILSKGDIVDISIQNIDGSPGTCSTSNLKMICDVLFISTDTSTSLLD